MVLFSLAHFFCRDAVSAGSWVPLLAVVREDAVKLSTINVEKRTELCFSFLIPSSEFIFSCNNILLLCTSKRKILSQRSECSHNILKDRMDYFM